MLLYIGQIYIKAIVRVAVWLAIGLTGGYVVGVADCTRAMRAIFIAFTA